MRQSHPHLLPLLAILCCALTVFTMVREALWLRRNGRIDSVPTTELEAFGLVHDRILRDYVVEQDARELVFRAIEGMVSSLDEYSRFVPPADVREFLSSQIEGTYDGIGVIMVGDSEPVTVFWPLAGGPAERAGLQVGDRILEVDGELLRRADARDRLLGSPGTEAVLTIGRGEESFEVTVVRGPVRQASVKWAHLADPARKIAYIHVDEFSRGVTRQFDAAIEELRVEAGGQLEGLILDLRGNPGGLLHEAVHLCDRFVKTGTIVTLKDRHGQVDAEHLATEDATTLPDVPLVVLLDRRSASASEVFSAAIQDHGRGEILGERSFGKGIVQQVYTWPDRDFRLKMTDSYYYTPSGRNIERRLRRAEDGEDPGGVDPDVPIALTREAVRANELRLRVHEPPRALLPQIRAVAAEFDEPVDTVPTAADDAVLAAALEALGAPRAASDPSGTPDPGARTPDAGESGNGK